MTPVPIQPIRVLPGSALLTAMMVLPGAVASSQRLLMMVVERHADGKFVRSKLSGERGCVSAPSASLGALTQPRSPVVFRKNGFSKIEADRWNKRSSFGRELPAMSVILPPATTTKPSCMPRLRAPIVLVHGLFGFDSLRLGPWLIAHYFQGIPEALRAAGNRVLVAALSPTG